MALQRSLSRTDFLTNALSKNGPMYTAFFQRSSFNTKESTSRETIHNLRIRGIDILRNPRTNKGTAFTVKERQLLGVYGLVPPAVHDMNEQVIRVTKNFVKRSNDLDRFIYLMSLQDRNEKLFYRVLSENVEEMMPIIYTPTVGAACQQYGLVYRRPRGLFISIRDKGHIHNMLCNWPERNVKAIVVTDGERILGLGDLGAYGMGIPVGKLSLYTALGGVSPSKCLPIMLDIGTNNKALHDDPLYIGLPQNRLTGDEYDEFLDEFMAAVRKRYGSRCLIQFEDFANHNAYRLLERYRNNYCVFNDDIQGTAAVAVAGILASLRITGKKLSDNTIAFLGAGGASTGIAELLVLAMMEEGVPKQEARDKIWMMDIGGLLTKNRTDMVVPRSHFAKDYEQLTNLEDLVEQVKPSMLFGASAAPGAFTEKTLRLMGQNNERPIIFALSNPTSKAECTAEQAYNFTEGRCVFASGSPFPKHTMNGKTFYPGQGNNAYIFPGVALGTIACEKRHVEERIFLQAAQRVASMVTQENLDQGRVYPPLHQLKEVSLKIAVDIAEDAFLKGTAMAYPEPKNKEEFINSFLYNFNYDCFEPATWDWDKM